MCGSGREALPEYGRCREAYPDVQEWWGRLHACLGVVERPSHMFGSSREALPDFREWLAHPPVGTGDVERPSQMSGSGWHTLP